MRFRSLGRTGWQISEVGFGAWGIGGGWGALDDTQAIQSLHRYLDLGGNFLDTAYGYGDGHSEQIIGRVLKERSSDQAQVYVASKVPPKTFKWPLLPNVDVRDSFPADWVIQYAERSLKNLNVETLDLLQLHAWTDAYNEQLDWYEGLVKLREQGKVRAFGVSINDYVPQSGVRLAQSGRVEAIQVIYNIFEQTPEQALFPAAQENGVGILVRVPFEEGGLTGTIRPDTHFHPDDWRGQYFTPERLIDLGKHMAPLQKLIDENTVSASESSQKNSSEKTLSLAMLALRFCLHHPAVSSVLPGMRRLANVDANMAASDVRLSDVLISELRGSAWQHGWSYPWCEKS